VLPARLLPEDDVEENKRIGLQMQGEVFEMKVFGSQRA
jgi:hypothetical protein